MAQLPALALGEHRGAGSGVVHVIGQLPARNGQPALGQHDRWFENAPVLEFLQGALIQARRYQAAAAAVIIEPLVDVIADSAAVEAQLQAEVVIHLALHHALLYQVHHAVDEHLGGDIEPLLEQFTVRACRRQGGQGRHGVAVIAVVLLAQDAGIGHRVPQRTDTDLQGAAIRHQGAGMQSGGVVLQRHRGIGHGEQGLVILRVAHQQVEAADPDLGVVFHVRKVGVDLADGNAGPARVLVHLHQFDPGIGVTGQAHREALRGIPRCHQLHQHIGAGIEHVAGDVGVIAGDVIALGRGHILH